jgi:RHS repeat-associated protein
MDHQIALVDSAQGVRYPLVMQPNSTIATVDAKGLVDGQYSYEPYGATNVTHVPKADYPFLFTGRTRVTDGLYYYRARFYDPGTSRFVSEDPLEFGGGGPNLYEYVEGKPAFSVDPNGQDSLPVQWNLILGTNGIEDAYAWQAQMQQEAYQRERDRKLYSAVQKVVDKEVATAKAHPLGVACEVFASLPCKLIARVPIHPALRVGAFAICEVATTLGCAPLFKEHDQPAGPKAPASCPDGSSPFDRKSAPQSFPSSQSTGVE